MLDVLHEQQPQFRRSVHRTSADNLMRPGYLACDSKNSFGDNTAGCIPMPIGRTPGCFSSAVRRHARSGAMDEECTYVVLILVATDAREAQRSLDAPLWLVQRRLHWWKSRPEGPAAPFTLRAAEWMALWSRDSNIMGWGSCGSYNMLVGLLGACQSVIL